MNKAFVAFGVALLASVAAAVILRLAGVESGIAEKITIGTLGSTAFLHQHLEKAAVLKKDSATNVPTIENYGPGPLAMVIFGALMLLAVTNVSAAVIGLMAAVSGVPDTGLAAYLAFPGLAMLIAASVSVGIWVGRRARRNAVALTLACIVLFRVEQIVLDQVLMTPDQWKEVFGLDRPAYIRTQLVTVLITGLLGILGVWRGARTRVQRYLAYLAGLLPHDTRAALVDLAREEVAKSLSQSKV